MKTKDGGEGVERLMWERDTRAERKSSFRVMLQRGISIKRQAGKRSVERWRRRRIRRDEQHQRVRSKVRKMQRGRSNACFFLDRTRGQVKRHDSRGNAEEEKELSSQNGAGNSEEMGRVRTVELGVGEKE